MDKTPSQSQVRFYFRLATGKGFCLKSAIALFKQNPVFAGYSEAYSWGVGEDESRDGLYCGFESVVRAAVIGVQDTPSFEVRDDTFNEIADTIDGRVIPFIGVGEFTMSGFPGRGGHSQTDVALVSNMTLTVEGCEETGFLDGLCIVECNSLCMSHLSMIYYLH